MRESRIELGVGKWKLDGFWAWFCGVCEAFLIVMMMRMEREDE